MTNKKVVDLMIKSTNNNPYKGVLCKKENITEAINLAKLCKEFADNGQRDEAMLIESEQWIEIINELENKLC